MKTKRQMGLGEETPAVKLPRTAKRAARAAVRSQLPRHRRILVHPVTVLMLLCIGVLIVGLTYKTLAASSVTATVRAAAPPLTEGAVMTTPTEGQVFTAIPITAHGTCPADSYIKLYRNSVFSGSAWCVSGSFDIETTLSAGINTLQAQDYNITDNPGPTTSPVNVTYAQPVPPPLPAAAPSATMPTSTVATSAASANQNIAPLLLTGDYSFHTFVVGNSFTWELEILGGLPPYRVSTDWGDKTTTTMTITTSRKFSISHQYRSAGYYPVKLQTTDARGDKAFLQLSALIKVPGTVGFTVKQSAVMGQIGPGFIQGVHHWLWLIWPSYGVATLMVFSFWLGQRQEVLKLARIHQHYSARRHP